MQKLMVRWIPVQGKKGDNDEKIKKSRKKEEEEEEEKKAQSQSARVKEGFSERWSRR